MDDKNEFLKIHLDLPSIRLDIKTADPKNALIEIRKILDALHVSDQVVYEEFVTQELKNLFSDTFTSNQTVMSAIKRLLKEEEDYRVFTTEIPTTSTIDLEQKTRTMKIKREDVQKRLGRLQIQLTQGDVKQGIVHVVGSLPHQDRLVIMDNIHKHMPTAQLRAFHSEGTVGDVVVECIFFGEFPEGEDE